MFGNLGKVLLFKSLFLHENAVLCQILQAALKGVL